MLTYGLRGMCAYAHHAEVLGQSDEGVDAFVAEAYAFLCSQEVRWGPRGSGPLPVACCSRASLPLPCLARHSRDVLTTRS